MPTWRYARMVAQWVTSLMFCSLTVLLQNLSPEAVTRSASSAASTWTHIFKIQWNQSVLIVYNVPCT